MLLREPLITATRWSCSKQPLLSAGAGLQLHLVAGIRGAQINKGNTYVMYSLLIWALVPFLIPILFRKELQNCLLFLYSKERKHKVCLTRPVIASFPWSWCGLENYLLVRKTYSVLKLTLLLQMVDFFSTGCTPNISQFVDVSNIQNYYI